MRNRTYGGVEGEPCLRLPTRCYSHCFGGSRDEHQKPQATRTGGNGAGAAVDFGIPITSKFGELIGAAIKTDRVCVSEGGADAYFDVQTDRQG